MSTRAIVLIGALAGALAGLVVVAFAALDELGRTQWPADERPILRVLP